MAADKVRQRQVADVDYAKYDFRSGTEAYELILDKGLTEKTVREISSIKSEPDWMLENRLKGLKAFNSKPMPSWGADLSAINFDSIVYYMRASQANKENWDDVPDYIKNTFDRLGIPEAEKKFLAGVGAQYDSEVVYHSIRKDLEKLGVVFLGMDQGLIEYPELVKKHFGTVVPFSDNKFAALNTAVWSGGSFVYIPENVKVEIPLQAYFRINAENMGQFERTLIIADEKSQVHYVEGCFTKGTPIRSQLGTKSIEYIVEGDQVWTHENRWMPVYKLQNRPYSGSLHQINYFGDSRQTLEATDEHPFLAVDRSRDEYKNLDFEPRWTPAKELKKGDYLAIPIDREVDSQNSRTFLLSKGIGRHGFSDVEFTLETDADFFRLMGYYLSEGTTMSGHYVSFSFNENEREYIDDVKQLVQKYFKKGMWEQPPRNHGISLVLSSTMAARFFMREFGHHAHTKKLPVWVMKESVAKQSELLKAYWRGDGSYMYHQYAWGVKRMFRINTVSEVLAEQVRDLLLRQNIFSSINVQRRASPRKPMYCIYVGGSFLDSFGALVGVVPVSETLSGSQHVLRKTIQKLKSYAQITEKYVFVPIKRIESRTVSDVLVYNFSVETDESYVANGVVVHNCTAPKYSSQALHSAVVEVIAKPDSQVRYTTIQNWSNNIYNLVTKRAIAHERASVEWVDGNLGSRVTQKYPCVILKGEGSRAEILSIALAGKGQHQDAGAKVYHLASNTTSRITSKSISKDGGRSTYRGLLRIAKGLKNVKSNVVCDALLLDSQSRSDTYPTIEVDEPSATVAHEAKVGKIGEDQVFYLTSRGIPEATALTLIVLGFIQPFTKSLPLEYAVELNRLIELEMEGSVG